MPKPKANKLKKKLVERINKLKPKNQGININVKVDNSRKSNNNKRITIPREPPQAQQQQRIIPQFIPMYQQPQPFPSQHVLPQAQTLGIVEPQKRQTAELGVQAEFMQPVSDTGVGTDNVFFQNFDNTDEQGIELPTIKPQYRDASTDVFGLQQPAPRFKGVEMGVNTEQVNVLTKPPVKAFPLDKPELAKSKSAPLESTTSTQPVVATVRQEEERLSDDMRLYQRIGGDVDEYNQIESKFRPSKWKSAVTQYYNAKILPNTEYNNFTEYIKANFDGRNPKQIGVEDYRQLARNAFK